MIIILVIRLDSIDTTGKLKFNESACFNFNVYAEIFKTMFRKNYFLFENFDVL